MSSTEQFGVIFFSENDFNGELKCFLKRHFEVSVCRYREPLASLENFDVCVPFNQCDKEFSTLPSNIILFGLPDFLDQQKPCFKPFDWVKELEKEGKKVSLIEFDGKWLKQVRKDKESWNKVNLSKQALTPVERLLVIFKLNAVTKLAHSCLDYSYEKQKVSSDLINLATEEHFRVLDTTVFAVFPLNKKQALLSTLMLFQRENPSNLPIFAFLYEGDSPPLIENHSNLKDLSLCEFALFANQKHFDQISCFFRGFENCLWGPNSTKDVFLRLSFNLFSELCEDNDFNQDINKAINQACSVLMGQNRLLSHFSCTFYLPIYTDKELPSDVEGKEEVKRIHYPIDFTSKDNAKSEAQAYWYFHPPIRDYLFDRVESSENSEMESIHEWRLMGEHNYQWTVDIPDQSAKISADVTNVCLYQYFNKLCYLAITVKPSGGINEDLLFIPEDDRWWQGLVFSTVDQWQIIKDRKISNWLLFTKLARVLYPSFTQQEDEGKIAKNILNLAGSKTITTSTESNNLAIEALSQDNFSELVFYFLNKFFGSESLNTWLASDYNQVFDDRLFVNVAYGYTGTKLDDDTADRLFKLALYVDTKKDTYFDCDDFAYDPDFIKKLAEQHGYARWKAVGILSGYTNYSNVYMGHGCFFNDVIAKDHVPLVYGRMLLVTLFYQASLRLYSREIMLITEKFKGMKWTSNSDKNREQLALVSTLRESFIRFTNVYWFHEVTSQTQGQEVFKLQQQALSLKENYDFLKDEMERMDEYLQGRNNQIMAEQSNQLNSILFWFTMAALWIALTGLLLSDNNMTQHIKVFFDSSYFTVIDNLIQKTKEVMSLGALIILLPLIAYSIKPVLQKVNNVCQPLRKQVRAPFLLILLVSIIGCALYYNL